MSNKYSGPASSSFPLKLMEILDTEDLSHIVSWLPHGRGFTIHDKKRFASEILPQHFKVAQFTSFTRRMNRWRFTLQKLGNHKSNYFHPLFVKGEISKCLDMRPKPQKVANRIRRALSPIPSQPNKEVNLMTHLPQRAPNAPMFTSALQGRPSSFCKGGSNKYDMPNVQSAGPNRNLLQMPLPGVAKTQRKLEFVHMNSMTNKNDLLRQYYCMDNPSLPPSRDSVSYCNHHYHHVPPPLMEHRNSPPIEAAHCMTDGSALWGPYDNAMETPSYPSSAMHHRQIRNDPFYRASYDEALTESYAQHQAYLARQVELSRLAFMSIRERSSSPSSSSDTTVPMYARDKTKKEMPFSSPTMSA